MTVRYLQEYMKNCKQRGKQANILELYFNYRVDKELWNE